MGFLGHLIPSLNKDLILREGLKCPQKGIFLTPKMSFSRFSHFDLCRGTLGSQNYRTEKSFSGTVKKSDLNCNVLHDRKLLPDFLISWSLIWPELGLVKRNDMT